MPESVDDRDRSTPFNGRGGAPSGERRVLDATGAFLSVSRMEWTWERFPDGDEATFHLVNRWPVDGAPGGAEVLKPGSVWRIGQVVVKVGRAHRLRRSARAWQRLRPVLTPEPLVLGCAGTHGILAMRNCPGESMATAWGEPRAREAMADLIASLYGRRIIHGDLSPNNILWDGTQAWLIDLDGLRNPCHSLFWRRQLRLTWAWLYHRLPDRPLVRAAYERCCRSLGLSLSERRWQTVLAEERRIQD